MSCCGSDNNETKVEGATEDCCKEASCCENNGLCKRFMTKFKENKTFRRVTLVVAALAGLFVVTRLLKKKK